MKTQSAATMCWGPRGPLRTLALPQGRPLAAPYTSKPHQSASTDHSHAPAAAQ
jgi:hypothetical protein